MYTIRLILLVALITSGFHADAEKLFLKSDAICKVWWAGSTCKVMRDDPAPVKTGDIKISSAKNETESFQLVLNPRADLKALTATVSDFRKEGGPVIPSKNVIIRNVEYVHVSKPSGRLHRGGWYPDPLPLYEKPFDAVAGVNTTLWVTVKVPENAVAGKYAAKISLRSGSWKYTVPVELDIWDFTLPDTPFMRSGFGLSTDNIRQYHGLETDEELKQVVDHYFMSFKDYKISPYSFYNLSPIKKSVKGVRWQGGTFDPDTVYEGRYAYQVTDREGRCTDLIGIDPTRPYVLKWQAKALSEKQKYTVTVHCYDEDKKPVYWSLKWMVSEGGKSWQQDSLYIDPMNYFTFEDLPDYRPFPENARYAEVRLYAGLPENDGSPGGTVWFDDFQFIDLKTGKNSMPAGNFEQDIDDLELELDFSEFDNAGRKYLDELGFTGFRVQINELKPGPFVGKKTGWFNGFLNGTPEYEKLISLYLKGFQDHLKMNGWLGKEYLYWVDEPKHEDYEFVRDGMNTIHRVAPELTRFITENNPGPEIMDVTDIGCPVLYKVDPVMVKEWTEKGREFWSYLMCWPKEPHLNLFIDSDAINMRMWLWMSYQYHLKGILVWQSNQWNGGRGAAPEGVLQNIWEDPMTYKSGHGTPYGSAPEFGNGDGMFFYPPNRDPNNDRTKYLTGPVPSLRLEILREGLDDYDYMMLLEDAMEHARPDQQGLVRKARQLLDFGPDVFVNDQEYTKDPEMLVNLRLQMGELLEQFKSPAGN